MSTDQDVIFTATARNIAQIINGRVSTDTDGNPTIYAEDYAAAAVDVLREARIPSGVDRAAAWDAAVAMLHPAVRAAIAAFNPDAEPTFPGEDFPEPADGEGARVAREEAAWERQIKAAPMPAVPVREPDRVPEWLTERYPIGSVWHVDDEAGAPYGLCTLRSGGVKATIIGHILIAEHGEAFTSLSGLLITIGSARIAIHARAWVWIAKRVDA
jgi:hypothetical protein